MPETQEVTLYQPPPMPPEVVPRKINYPKFRKPHTLYKEEYCQSILDWFAERCARPTKEMVFSVTEQEGMNRSSKTEARTVMAEMPQVADWAWEVGVTILTVQNWAKQHPDFGYAYARARLMQERFIREAMATGVCSSAVGTFLLSNICRQGAAGGTPLVDGAGGWSNKTEMSITSAQESNAPVFADASPEQLDAIEQIAKLAAAAGVRIKVEGFEAVTAGQ